MTEKRFKVFTGNNYGVQSADGEVFIDSIVSVGDADVLVDLLNELSDENEQLKQQLNKVFVLLDIKQKISKENMEEWAFKDVPASTVREYYYSGMLDACMQLRDEILNGDVE